MDTLDLTYEQRSIVNAVLNLINSMDEKMRSMLLKELESKKEEANISSHQKSKWINYPISKEVMSMTFKQRKPINGSYKTVKEEELKKKYL